MNKILSLIISVLAVMAITWKTQAPEKLTVEDPRPLSAAILILQEKYGWQINYEDPPYRDPKDLIDHTHPTYRGPHRAIGPKGGRVEIQYFLSPATGKPESPTNLLEMLVADHTNRGNPGQFQVKVFDGVNSVQPIEGSIMDTRITIENKERTYTETLGEFYQTLSRAIGIHVRNPGISGPMFERLSFGAENEPARDVLMRLLNTRSSREYSWHLLYSTDSGYFLNLHSRPKKTESAQPTLPTPSGRQEWRDITFPTGQKVRRLVNVPKDR